jgi:hypothetical protein
MSCLKSQSHTGSSSLQENYINRLHAPITAEFHQLPLRRNPYAGGRIRSCQLELQQCRPSSAIIRALCLGKSISSGAISHMQSYTACSSSVWRLIEVTSCFTVNTLWCFVWLSSDTLLQPALVICNIPHNDNVKKGKCTAGSVEAR